jgi:hypothetical protein
MATETIEGIRQHSLGVDVKMAARKAPSLSPRCLEALQLFWAGHGRQHGPSQQRPSRRSSPTRPGSASAKLVDTALSLEPISQIQREVDTPMEDVGAPGIVVGNRQSVQRLIVQVEQGHSPSAAPTLRSNRHDQRAQSGLIFTGPKQVNGMAFGFVHACRTRSVMGFQSTRALRVVQDGEDHQRMGELPPPLCRAK